MKLANWTRYLVPSAMQRTLEINNFSEYISFALGLPDEETFPAEFYAAVNFTKQDLQYSPVDQLLKSHITKIMKMRGVICKEGEIFITTGAQQGISLMAKLFCDAGDNIIVESLTYPGFIQIAHTLNINIISIPTDYNDGMNLEKLEIKIKSLNKKPSLIYIVADGNNPTGTSLSTIKRKKLVDIAVKYEIPILEDDPYGLLYYDNDNQALKAFNKDMVCYVGSFSKIIAPSLRIGWIVIPEELMEKLSILKDSYDINTTTLSQKILVNFLEENKLNSHLKMLRSLYVKKRDKMTNSINSYLGNKVQFKNPNNGINLWIRFNNGINSKHLFQKALKKKLLFIPGSSFNVSNDSKLADNCIRLNFSHCKMTQIEEGIKILSSIV